ncbi:hypothetical protein L9F63_019577, partial [Diploptera punctata]
DHNAAHLMATEVKKEEFYAEMKATLESCMDFSIHWYIFNVTNQGDLFKTKIHYIIPVDLNIMIQWNVSLLAHFCFNLGLKKQ